MKVSRIQASNLKSGDVVQANVASVKQLDRIWYQVQSVERTAKDVVVKFSIHTFPGGVKSKSMGAFTDKFNPRTVFAKMV